MYKPYGPWRDSIQRSSAMKTFGYPKNAEAGSLDICAAQVPKQLHMS
jgi:hypothetical protein